MGCGTCKICSKFDSKWFRRKYQMCNACYQRSKRHNGDPTAGRKQNNGRSKHPLYLDYIRMLDRVRGNPTGCKENYVQRNITICERWLGKNGFDNFAKDMGDKPSYGKGKGGRCIWSLDRINNDLGYSPSNCRWANSFTQANNTRRNKKYTVHGVTGTLPELSRHFGIVPAHNVDVRFYCYGWDLEKALLTPVKEKR